MRREVLRLIWDQELPAGEIAAAFALTKPTISQHLGALRRSGLVTMTATSTFRHYRARQGVLQRVNGALSNAGKWSVADDRAGPAEGRRRGCYKCRRDRPAPDAPEVPENTRSPK
ncbi:MAG TPA: ArsR family transcriptional regulator [Acidimicrobiales bacterium]|nr:ArsR family transcriptional regulator [Acidimicrobiales bacterium]